MSDTRLQELYARALGRRSGGANCVAPEELLALVRREGPEEQRLKVLDHAMACAECRREFELLRALAKAGESSAGRFPAGVAWRRVAPLAIAACLLILVGTVVRMRQTPDYDVPRGASEAVVLVAPRADVDPSGPVEFVWRTVAGAQRYRLEVLDQNESVAFSGETADTALTMPPNRLGSDLEYRWWVRDVSPGAQRASSLRRFRTRSE
jgi:hypothetical protein